MRLISMSRAYSIASQWGSYNDARDPGACLYGFHHGDGRPVSDVHRSDCLIYLRAILNRTPVTMTVREERDLRSLVRFIANCPLRPVAPAMIAQPVQQQQARARGARPVRGERRNVIVRASDTGETFRVLTSVPGAGFAMVEDIPSNEHRAGELRGMLLTHGAIRKAVVFASMEEGAAYAEQSRRKGWGHRYSPAAIIADPAPDVA